MTLSLITGALVRIGRWHDSRLQAHPTPLSSVVTCVSSSLCAHVEPSKFHLNKIKNLELISHACVPFSPVGLGVLSHTLTPRMKASHIALQTMRGHLDAVYDITVAYEGSLDASRQRKPAPSMPGEHKRMRTLYSLLRPQAAKPGSRCVIYFFSRSVIRRSSLSSCFSLTGQLKTFLPIHDSFPVILFRS